MLEPGMHADFAAYDVDPMTVEDVRDAAADHDRVARPRGLAGVMAFLSHFLGVPA